MNRVNLVKNRAVVVWAAVGLFSVLGGSALRADEAADRKALDALYQKGAAGVRKGDFSFVFSLETADFKRKTLLGQIFNRQQSDRSNRAALTRLKKIVSFDVKIVSCKSTGSKAVVVFSQRMVMQMEDLQGRTHTGDITMPGRDTWIKTAGGWRNQFTEDMAPTETIIDGHRMPMRRTPAPHARASQGPASQKPAKPATPIKPAKK